MEYTTIKIGSNSFLKTELHSFQQGDNSFYLCKISAAKLLEMYTVRPTTYDIDKNSALAKLYPEESQYYEHIVSERMKVQNDKDFQRKFSSSRVKDIANFLDEDPYPFFPNSIIATCDLGNSEPIQSVSVLESEVEQAEEHVAYLLVENSRLYALIPHRANTILVIDGQHRIEGLKKAKSLDKENYEIFLSLIVGYDRSVVAKQFYTINYEQKSVNKSLLYHLMGEFSSDIDEISFLHNVVKILNELEISPFFKRVKMLGTIPTSASPADREKLSISQAAIIDHLLPTISNSTLKSIYPPIFLYFYYNAELRPQIINVLSRFFRAVSDLQTGWETPGENLISKSMGVGALIRVLQFLWAKLLIDKYEGSLDAMCNIDKEDFKQALSGLEKVDFSKDGKFGKVGSAGSMNKIKEEIIKEVDYFNAESYSDFVSDFKNNYHDKCLQALLGIK